MWKRQANNGEDMFMAHVTDKKIGSSIPKESKKDDSWIDKWEAVLEEET